MKLKLVLIFVVQFLLWSCKSSSISKRDLISENKRLKETLSLLEKVQTTTPEIVLEVNKMNVVYRGIFNPIKVQVPNAKNVIVSAPGLSKVDDNGNYKIAPTTGQIVDVKIEAEMYDGTKVFETKQLRIFNITRGRSLFNGKECHKCNLKLKGSELINGKITFNIVDYLMDSNFEIVYFRIKFPNRESITIEGNTLDETYRSITETLKQGDIVQIFDLGLKSDLRYCRVAPIIIEIVE